MRKFEVVRDQHLKYGAKKEDVILPVRKTKHAVAYDVFSPVDITIEPNKTELVWTNVKATFNTDEALMILVRSSMGRKGVILANGVGLLECDYYNNDSNDGNIGFLLYNHASEPYIIKKGDAIGQAFFFKFLTVNNETTPTETRKGGFGSTDK